MRRKQGVLLIVLTFLLSFLLILFTNSKHTSSYNAHIASSSDLGKLRGQYHAKHNVLEKSVIMKSSNMDDLQLFSAFAHSSGEITVIITSYGFFTQRLYCRYFDEDRKEMSSAVVSKVFPDFVISCSPENTAFYISLSINQHDVISTDNIVLIKRRTKAEHFFSICLAPIFGEQPKWLLLLEFIEYYKLQGASHFYVYDFESDEDVMKILEYYKKQELVEIISINSSSKCMSRHRCRHEMQLQDCVARSREHSSWIALIDMDERIYVDDEKTSLLSWIRKNEETNIAEFRFRCRWILRHAEISSLNFPLSKDFITKSLPMLNYHNTSHVAPVNHTTKSIVNPLLVNSQGVHQVLSYKDNSKLFMVSPEEAVVRHYRLQEGWSFFLKEAETFGSFVNTSVNKMLETKLDEAVRNVVDIIFSR